MMSLSVHRSANQLLAYGGYGRHCADYDNYSNLPSNAGTLVTYGSGYVTTVDGTALYNRHCEYNSPPYNGDCVNQSTQVKSKRRVTSSPTANHAPDTCYYKKQRLVGLGYSYDATTTSSSSPAAAAVAVDGYNHAFDVTNHV